jgi:hypothetical protein
LDLNVTQINKYAENALREFDEERLKIPKQFDAFDFTELHLGLTADPQRLTPNLQIYGLMALTMDIGGYRRDRFNGNDKKHLERRYQLCGKRQSSV